MRSSALVSSVALAFASVSHADIFQYEDCDGDGSLLLTELDPEPFVDLSGLYLGCAELTNAYMVFSDLCDADLSGANLNGVFLEHADLENANLSGANLNDARLFRVRSGGIVGTPNSLPPEWSLMSGYLIGPDAKLSSANLSGVDLTNANLSGADLTNANLTNANLTNANMSGANLTNANMSGANLSGADLTGADLFGADLTGAIGNVNVDISDLAVDQTGSCCTYSGCASISESNCFAMGGTWTEGGSCYDCQPAADDCPADVDGDGTIGFSDVLVILNDWGVCP